MCTQNIIIVTREERAVWNHHISLKGLTPYNHEKVDTRIFTHERHAVAEGYSMPFMWHKCFCHCRQCISSAKSSLDWKSCGLQLVKDNLRWIPLHVVNHSIGPGKSKGIPFFHASLAVTLCQLFVEKEKTCMANLECISWGIWCLYKVECISTRNWKWRPENSWKVWLYNVWQVKFCCIYWWCQTGHVRSKPEIIQHYFSNSSSPGQTC